MVQAADGGTYQIKGDPLPYSSRNAGPGLIGSDSNSRIIGAIRSAYEGLQRQMNYERPQYDLVYVPPEKLGPEEAEKVRTMYKLNELILAAIKAKVEATLGPGRLAALIVPTQFEAGHGLHRAGPTATMSAISSLRA